MYCSQCGEPINPDERFCPKCGEATDNEQPPTPAESVPQAPESESESQPAQFEQPPATQATSQFTQSSLQQPLQPQPPTAPPRLPYKPLPSTAYQAAKPKRPHYAPGSFIEHLHSFGGSTLFFIGIILFSAGAIFDLLIGFETVNLLNLLILALPITAMWLIFASSKLPKLPEKSLPAITLFKVATIIALVKAGIIAIVSLLLFIALITESIVHAIILLLALAGIIVFIILFFVPLFKLIKNLTNGIIYGQSYGLGNLKVFNVFVYIWVGAFGMLALISLISPTTIMDFADDVMFYIRTSSSWFDGLITTSANDPSLIGNVFLWTLGMSESWADRLLDNGGDIAAIFRLVKYAGIVLCVKALNNFNSGIIRRTQH